jgi:hypothetical protein
MRYLSQQLERAEKVLDRRLDIARQRKDEVGFVGQALVEANRTYLCFFTCSKTALQALDVHQTLSHPVLVKRRTDKQYRPSCRHSPRPRLSLQPYTTSSHPWPLYRPPLPHQVHSAQAPHPAPAPARAGRMQPDRAAKKRGRWVDSNIFRGRWVKLSLRLLRAVQVQGRVQVK